MLNWRTIPVSSQLLKMLNDNAATPQYVSDGVGSKA